MSVPISNANTRTLDQNSGTLPDASTALLNYFQIMNFIRIAKNIINYQVIETQFTTNFLGVWQMYSDRQLQMLAHGQREWKWFTCHAQPGVTLNPDEIVNFQGNNYRVMFQRDYTLYGYIEYHLIQDYSSGNQLSTEDDIGITTEQGEPIVVETQADGPIVPSLVTQDGDVIITQGGQGLEP